MKKILTILLICALAISPVMALSDTATLTFTTFVGETTNNTVMRITENVDPLLSGDGTLFDSEYFSAPQHLEINNLTLDNSENDVEGTFSILIRRQSGHGATLTVEANPLVSGTENLNYTLSNDLSSTEVLSVAKNTKTQVFDIPAEIASAGSSIIRYQRVFTYIIPEDITALSGTYEGTMIFTMTTT